MRESNSGHIASPSFLTVQITDIFINFLSTDFAELVLSLSKADADFLNLLSCKGSLCVHFDVAQYESGLCVRRCFYDAVRCKLYSILMQKPKTFCLVTKPQRCVSVAGVFWVCSC